MLETLLKPGDTEERCGLLMKDDTIVEIDNIAPDKTIGFYIDHAALLPYADDENVAATWHTHPDGDPTLSGEDLDTFRAWPSWHHYVIGLRSGKVAVIEYRVDNGAVIICD